MELEQFAEARLADPALHALMDRIRVVRDAQLTARYPEGIPNRLEIALSDGRILTREVTYPRGHARNPMTDAEVEAKYFRLAERTLPRSRAERIRDLVWRLEALSDVGELTEALTG